MVFKVAERSYAARSLVLLAFLIAGCASTSLGQPGDDPGNPRAAIAPVSEPPSTLKPGFDPDVNPTRAATPAHDHSQHHLHTGSPDARAPDTAHDGKHGS